MPCDILSKDTLDTKSFGNFIPSQGFNPPLSITLSSALTSSQLYLNISTGLTTKITQLLIKSYIYYSLPFKSFSPPVFPNFKGVALPLSINA